MKPLRSVGLWGTTLLLTPPMATLAGVAALAGDRTGRCWWGASRTWARGLLGAAGMTELIVKGVEVLYSGSPFLLMANHESHLDPPALILASERPLGFLAKQELKWIPFFGWAMEQTGHVFVDRRNQARSHASIDRAAARIAEGRCVLVFPEGTRTVDGELGPFKKGGFVLAMKSGAAIVPVGVAGTRAIFPAKNRYVQGRGPVAVVFGEPIPTVGVAPDEKEGLMEVVRARVTLLRAEARALVASHRS